MSSASPRQTLPPPGASFTPFGRLPKELRLAIWEEVLLEPRIVYLRPKRLEFSKPPLHMCQYHPYYHPKAAYMFCSTIATSKVIMTCKESYEVASKASSKTFSTPSYPPQTLFNYERDTLYIHWGTSNRWAPRFDHAEASCVKYLAVYDPSRIQSPKPSVYRRHEDWLAAITTTFCNLERLTIVVAQIHNSETSKLILKKAELFHSTVTFRFPGVENMLVRHDLVDAAYRLKTRKLEVDTIRLEKFREKRSGKGRKFLNPMPKIEFQIMLAEELEKVFDEITRST